MLLWKFTKAVLISPLLSSPTKTSLVLDHCLLRRQKCFFLNLKKTLSIIAYNNLHENLPEKMSFDKEKYEDAIKALNGLQSNAATIAKMQKETDKRMQITSIPDMEDFLLRIGIDVNQLDRLNVIHVSGTKGKGSVCSFCESILRSCGLKTGFYSSPHLVEVRERIRINGKPLSHEMFTTYFFEVYDKLNDTAADFNNKMPGYFRFLTIMAFHVYLKEKVDVAVLEVGIGGSFDCTNVIRNPIVCGISKLEIDHASVLGRTIKQIAWHKAGIMKLGRPALTVSQNVEAEEILSQRAKEIQAQLYTIPTLSEFQETFPELGVKGDHQNINAALALQLARIWLHEKKSYVLREKTENLCRQIVLELASDALPQNEFQGDIKSIGTFTIPDLFKTGLKEAKWLGRCQTIERKQTTFFLDGAHTIGSMEACVQWFQRTSNKPAGKRTARVLCFFITGDRDFSLIMRELKKIDFDFAIFCPTILHVKAIDATSDLTNYNITRDSRLKKCDELQQHWEMISYKDVPEEKQEHMIDGSTNEHPAVSAVFPSISSAICWICMGREPGIEIPHTNACPDYPMVLRESDHVQLLVCGSLHLVGGVLKFLGPEV